MIVFREKVFVAPLIAALGGKLATGTMVVGTGASVVQGSKANKAQQEANQQMAEQQQRQTKQMLAEEKKRTEAYKEALKSGNITPPTQQTFSITLKRKTFANPVVNLANKMAGSGVWKRVAGTKTYKNIRGFGKDLYEVGKKRGSAQKIADGLAMGATMAGGGYLVDKAIQADMKKNGMPVDTPQKQEKSKAKKVKSAILGSGTALAGAAGTLFMARKGKLTTANLKKGAGMVGQGFKNQFRIKDPTTGKKSVLGPVLAVGLPAMTGVSYLAQKKQMKDQVEQSERQYSIPLLRNLGKNIKKAGGKVIDAPAALFGFGKKGRQELSNQLLSTGIKSGNPITKKVAKYVNPKKAIPGTIVGVGIGSFAFKPFEVGDKAVRKPLEAVDKKAYGYEKQQNQAI
jgi:hypothetical protein